MSLLSDPTPQEQTMQILRDTAVGTLNFLRAQFENGQRMVWSNPYGLTPQQVMDCLGANAGQMVSMSRGLEQFVNSLAPEDRHVHSHMPEGVTLTINADGTVTLS